MSATPIIITVPKYVTISPNPAQKINHHNPISNGLQSASSLLGEGVSDSGSESSSTAGRGKKRRLDHLTWEEKIQRKKLKNRVAAQTSRDRKKAKMDEMEQTIKVLTQKTEILQNKCDSLQSINESLLAKNQKLDQQVENLQNQLDELKNNNNRNITQQCSNFFRNNKMNVSNDIGSDSNSNLNRSAAGNNGIEVDIKRDNDSIIMEDNSSLPTLQDLLFDEDIDTRKLEELAESLLADIATDMESSDATSCINDAKNESCTERLFGSMVGTTTEIMESSKDKCKSITSIQDDRDRDVNVAVQQNDNDDKSTTADNPETVYGKYDEKTKCITIVLPGSNGLQLDEAVEEIVSEEEKDLIKEINDDDVTSDNDDDDDIDFDPVKEFLCMKNDNTLNSVTKIPKTITTIENNDSSSSNSPHKKTNTDLNTVNSLSVPAASKSPLSVHSYAESGYESFGSPRSDYSAPDNINLMSSSMEIENTTIKTGSLQSTSSDDGDDDMLFNYTLYDLFPSLA